MAEYGLTDQGLVIKDLPTIIQEKEDELKAFWGEGVNLNSESNLGQQVAIAAEREYNIWLLVEQVYYASSPATAQKAALDMCLALTGVTRQGISSSRITDQGYWGTPGTVILEGTEIKVPETENTYAVDTELTLGSGGNQVQLISFDSIPDDGEWSLTFRGVTTSTLSYSSTSSNVKYALESLDSIDEVTVTGNFSAGFTITFTGDNVKFRKNPELVPVSALEIGSTPVEITSSITVEGVYQAFGTLTATVAGSTIFAPEGTLSEVANAITGLDSTFNETDAVRGVDRESDAEVKLRRNQSLGAYGKGTAAGIEASVLDIEGVYSCRVYENDTGSVDLAGRPSKSFETYAYQNAEIGGGTPDPSIDQLIGETILRNKGAGMETFGDIPVFAVDPKGVQKTVKFSRPGTVEIYLTWTITAEPSKFPVNGPTLIGKDVVSYGNALGQGQDVIVYPYLMEVLQGYEGISDVITDIGDAPLPSGDDNVTIDNGSTGAVETSVWLPENIKIVLNTVEYTYNAVTQEWEA